jgi:UDP-GlcNAc:undecaprenyl-phosphate GlcNAc-1-phosphate transferase
LYLPWKAAGWIATVVWMVFAMNSFNLLDNMDGLSSGVAFIIAAVFLAVALETGQLFIAALLVVFAGSVLGFMVLNFPPAKIFMGDTGSYFLGYVLGLTAVIFSFVPRGVASQATLFPIALPFILFAIPFYDTLSVIWIRVREGRHPFMADKRHFSHRLTDLGMTKREAVFTIYAATLTTAVPALYLYHLNTFSLLGAVVQALLVLLLVAILEHAGARKKQDNGS